MNMAITCNHMGNLFSEHYDMKDATAHHKQSMLIYFKLFGIDHQKIWSLKDKIITWEKKKDLYSQYYGMENL